MLAACTTGLRYFAAVFTFAFAMGVARELVLKSLLGATAAVVLEIPIVLAASWIVARHLLRARHFTLGQRVVMGASPFALTMASEVALSALLRGLGPAEWAAGMLTPLGLVGLAGQVGFAAIPVLFGRLWSDTSARPF